MLAANRLSNVRIKTKDRKQDGGQCLHWNNRKKYLLSSRKHGPCLNSITKWFKFQICWMNWPLLRFHKGDIIWLKEWNKERWIGTAWVLKKKHTMHDLLTLIGIYRFGCILLVKIASLGLPSELKLKSQNQRAPPATFQLIRSNTWPNVVQQIWIIHMLGSQPIIVRNFAFVHIQLFAWLCTAWLGWYLSTPIKRRNNTNTNPPSKQ